MAPVVVSTNGLREARVIRIPADNLSDEMVTGTDILFGTNPAQDEVVYVTFNTNGFIAG